jgi:Uncharacterized protein conserved in bacteria
MNKIIIFATALFALFVFSGLSLAAGPKTIVGVWSFIEPDGPNKGKEASQMEIYEKGGGFEGKYIKRNDYLDPKCTECKDERKGKPVVGMVFVWDVKKTDDNEYKGKVYDVVKGREAKCELSLDGPDKLKQRACIAFLCKNFNWVRVK